LLKKLPSENPLNHLKRIGAYAAAVIMIWYSARGVHFEHVLNAFRRANLRLFIPVSLIGFLVWFFGENFLWSRLFTYFHRRTGFRELIPISASHYFLQLTNLAVASGALILFLNRRKGVSWATGGFTLFFQGIIDATLLAAMALAAVLLGLESPLRMVAPYAAAMFAGGVGIATLALWRHPRLRVVKWLLDRPALESFRRARAWHYGVLAAIRMPIFLAEGFILYGELRSFHINLSLFQAILFAPVSIFLSSIPLAPVGLGTLQVIFVKGLAADGAQADLLAAALAICFINLVWRLPLGFLAARSAFEPIDDSAPLTSGATL
jgi:uncharacterized membrane protein YbhN (UPF0104 family)